MDRRSVDTRTARQPVLPSTPSSPTKTARLRCSSAGTTAASLSHRYFWNPVAVDQLLADETVTSLVQRRYGAVSLGDHLGTLRDLATYNAGTNTTTIDNHRRYDSYGNLTSETNAAVDQLFGYTGRALDESTGKQNNLNRWYDGSTGSWLSQDPIGFSAGDPNLYRYVNNSTIDSTDPTGLVIRGTPEDFERLRKAEAWHKFFSDFSKSLLPGPGMLKLCGPASSAGGAAIGGLGNIGSHAAMAESQALKAALKWLGPGYKEIAPGVFRSCDGLRQFRWTSLGGRAGSGPYVNFEALDAAGNVVENLHIPIVP